MCVCLCVCVWGADLVVFCTGRQAGRGGAVHRRVAGQPAFGGDFSAAANAAATVRCNCSVLLGPVESQHFLFFLIWVREYAKANIP